MVRIPTPASWPGYHTVHNHSISHSNSNSTPTVKMYLIIYSDTTHASATDICNIQPPASDCGHQSCFLTISQTTRHSLNQDHPTTPYSDINISLHPHMTPSPPIHCCYIINRIYTQLVPIQCAIHSSTAT